ncbi:MAG: hypothetical protein SVX38_06005 [Chloroflexota bacterium]|nr:hypothetical protein [Chloroflexota bacterium]
MKRSNKIRVLFPLVLLLLTTGCGPATSATPSPILPSPTPTAPAGPEALPDATTPLKPTLPVEGSPPERLIFVEIQEERTTKASGQTTTFAGEQSMYDFDPNTGTLKGVLNGASGPGIQVIVGRLVTSQINQNKATSGQLYALTPDLSLPITFTVIESYGTVCFSYEGQEHCLQPGQEIAFQTRETGGGELEAGQTARRITVINHGLLDRANLQFK